MDKEDKSIPKESAQEKTNAYGSGQQLASDDVRRGFIQGVTFRSKPVQFAVVNGKAIFEGDIVLGEADEMTARAKKVGIIPEESIQRGIGITGMRYRWPNGLIPYEIDTSFTNKARVTDAIDHWHATTRVRFIQRTAQNASQFPNYLKFIPDPEGCWSSVGMAGSGKQNIGLAGGCLKGQAIHEIGHTVGLWHEQSREDRDKFVKINWQNIDSTKKHNFNQQISDGDDYGPYDYGSIMHYPSWAFSINGKPTIEPLTPGVAIGQTNGLSHGDVSAVYIMYWHRNGQCAADAPSAFQNFAPLNYNYELVVREGNQLRHYWYVYGQNIFNKGALFGNNVTGNPVIFQNRAPGNYNYELVVREGGQLQHYWFIYGQWKWQKGNSFGSNVSSDPVMFQNRAPGNYNYEVIVQEGDHLQHYWFTYGQWKWQKGDSFGSDIRGRPAVFQNHYPGNYNYEIVAREGDHLQHYWFDLGQKKWYKGMKFGSDVRGDPVMFQNHALGNYNYELVVQEGDHLQHYWFGYGIWNWNKALSFASGISGTPAIFQNDADSNRNYELVVKEGNHLQHYWYIFGQWKWAKGQSFGSNIQENPSIFQNHAPGNNNYELFVKEGEHFQHYWFGFGNPWKWEKGQQFS